MSKSWPFYVCGQFFSGGRFLFMLNVNLLQLQLWARVQSVNVSCDIVQSVNASCDIVHSVNVSCVIVQSDNVSCDISSDIRQSCLVYMH